LHHKKKNLRHQQISTDSSNGIIASTAVSRVTGTAGRQLSQRCKGKNTMTKFEEWLENEKEFVLKTQREIMIAKKSWDAAMITILNLIDTVNIKKGMENE
jgi:hypothetical protein